MSTLFVIGNGFDLFHGLHTSVSDFCEILSSKKVYGDDENAYETFMRYGIDWGEYENSLVDMDLDEIEEQNLSFPDYLSDHEYDRDGTVWYMNEFLTSLGRAVDESLTDMVENADIQLDYTGTKIPNVFKKGDAIISFNYTSTIERLYNINDIPILHIHGYYLNNDKLLFGYKDQNRGANYRETHFDPEDGDYYVDSQRESIVGFYERWKKELELDKLKAFLCSVSNIEKICVMGHSLSYVDSDYMIEIDRIISPQIWYVSQYENTPNLNGLKNYPFVDRIKFFSLNDLAN